MLRLDSINFINQLTSFRLTQLGRFMIDLSQLWLTHCQNSNMTNNWQGNNSHKKYMQRSELLDAEFKIMSLYGNTTQQSSWKHQMSTNIQPKLGPDLPKFMFVQYRSGGTEPPVWGTWIPIIQCESDSEQPLRLVAFKPIKPFGHSSSNQRRSDIKSNIELHNPWLWCAYKTANVFTMHYLAADRKTNISRRLSHV